MPTFETERMPPTTFESGNGDADIWRHGLQGRQAVGIGDREQQAIQATDGDAPHPTKEPLAPDGASEPAAPARLAAAESPAARRRIQVVMFASQKGGSGKTTLCGHLAVQVLLVGEGPVALIDIDPQGSLSDWWNARHAESPQFVKTTLASLTRDIESLERQGVRFVFIDTPPTITDTVRQVLRHADLVVVPTRPSPHDLRAVGPTLDMAEQYDIPLVFVVNAATPRARITSEVCVALSQHGTVAPVVVAHRTDYATSMIDGRTVMEKKSDSASSTEMLGLWQYLSERLARIERRTRRIAEPIASRHAFAGSPFDEPAFGRRRNAEGRGTQSI